MTLLIKPRIEQSTRLLGYQLVARSKPKLRLTIGCVSVLFAILLFSSGCGKSKSKYKTVAGSIVGSSMAPAVVGRHYQCTCGECGLVFRCDLEQADERDLLVCPNCGFGKIDRNDEASCQLKPEQAVEIKLENKSPERWQMVVFSMTQSRDSQTKAGIKRVVGLPGETISINKGNLYANDLLLRKPIAIQKSVRVPVYDSKYYSDKTPRWVSISPSTWNVDSQGLALEGTGQSNLAWVSYIQRRCYATKKDPSKIVSIEDSYGFNQSLTRDLNATSEIFLETEVEYAPSDEIGVRFYQNGVGYEFLIRVDNSSLSFRKLGIESESNDVEQKTFNSDLIRGGKFSLEFSSFDQQLFLLINQQQIFSTLIESKNGDLPSPANSDGSTQPDKVQIELGLGDSKSRFHRARIWRDLYYLPAPGISASHTLPNDSKDGFIVLGDNVPLSIDSRHWPDPVVTAEFVVGTVEVPQKQ